MPCHMTLVGANLTQYRKSSQKWGWVLFCWLVLFCETLVVAPSYPYIDCKSSYAIIFSPKVFLDEINTSSCVGVFKELMTDRTIDGKVCWILFFSHIHKDNHYLTNIHNLVADLELMDPYHRFGKVCE